MGTSEATTVYNIKYFHKHYAIVRLKSLSNIKNIEHIILHC